MVGVFRGYYDQNYDDPWFQAFAEELLEQSLEFAAWWKDYPLKQKSDVSLSIRSLDGESIIHYRIVSFFQINGEENVHCCVFTPVGDTNNLAIYQKNKTNPK